MAVWSKITNISDLPLELLTEIWKLLKYSPRTLGRILQVSKDWHNMALGMPGLWGALYITEDTNLDLLKTWIGRSQQTGLFICLDYQRAANSHWMITWQSEVAPPNYAERFIRVMECLVACADRWVHLEVFGPDTLYLLLREPLASLQAPRLTLLSIILDGPPDTPLPPVGNFVPPNGVALCSIEFTRVPLRWELFPLAPLTHLTLGPTNLGWNDLVHGVNHSPFLVSLGFVGGLPTSRASEETLALDLPSLTSLSLARLVVHDLGLLNTYLATPQIMSLALALPDEGSDFAPFLEQLSIRFPRLSHLAIDDIWLQPDTSLHTFFLQLTTVTDIVLRGLPRHMRPFWDALVHHMGDQHFLPALECITVVDIPILDIQDLVELRRQAGNASLCVTVHVSSLLIRRWNTSAWLVDNTRSTVLIEGPKKPSVQGTGFLHLL
ncbi:hypothetical protein FB45DRAFT_1030979 [Roridomyces roridus]|uniref:F-box domain-containing protein n=1 Tax=Roridomyces roridus TaxID=1738132 RepID=A0AAD7BMH6_9AGAR|nr:hypothetical protein FB45DRAFT_1030979 [Roridomyces roridus]